LNSRNTITLILLVSFLVPVVSDRVSAQEESALIDTMISVGDFSLHFNIIEGGSPTILLESGGGGDLSRWAHLAPRFARETGATVVSYSRPGFGKSDLPEAPCDMKVEAGWLWKALGKLGLDEDLVLVGFSYGGWMVRLEASMYPEDVVGIVFVDPFSAEFVDILGVEYLDDHPMTGKLPFDTSDLSKLNKQQKALFRMVGDGLGPKMEIMKKTTVPEDIPVMIIKSALQTLPKVEDQEAWDRAINQMAASIEGAELLVAEESNHMIPFNQPDLVADAVKNIVEKVRSGR
jgi:pimeloyl-ACP methyl ester carboxylesterase